jgi:hypothetical protein
MVVLGISEDVKEVGRYRWNGCGEREIRRHYPCKRSGIIDDASWVQRLGLVVGDGGREDSCWTGWVRGSEGGPGYSFGRLDVYRMKGDGCYEDVMRRLL